MAMFKKTKLEEKLDGALEKFIFPINISMKEIGNKIEGIYQGCLVKIGEGLSGGDLIMAAFMQENGNIHTCVAGSQLLKFLESFSIGYYLQVIRTQTITISGDRKFAQYEFSYNPLGIKSNNEIKFIDASEMMKTKQLKE